MKFTFSLLVITLLLFSFQATYAEVVTGDVAIDALGQFGDSTDLNDPTPVYTKRLSNNTPFYYGLNNPSGFALDNARHRLFVGDTSNNRILVFELTNSNTLLDHIPDFVIGQPSIAVSTLGTTNSILSAPRALLYDPVYDQLIVADSNNNRILFFDTSSISNGMPASFVLGQTDFTSGTGGTSATKFSAPAGLALKPATMFGNNRTLYVSDRGNNRVLIFTFAADPTGTAASNVLGQADFTSSATTTPSFQTSSPGGLALDTASNRLFVPCFSQHRVLVFDVSAPTDGMLPSKVLGQPDTTTVTSGNTADKLNFPSGVAYDAIGNNLFVSGVGNNRVTVFSVGSLLATITDGQPAINILGQSSFASTTAQSTASGISFFTGGKQDIFVDAVTSRLYVGQNYHRVSMFDISTISDGEDATDLIGQYDGTSLTNPVPSFTRTSANDAPNSLGFSIPRAVAVDTVHHRLFVADGNNHRVLEFDLDSNNQLLDHVPDRVLGQADFISNSSGASASRFDLSLSASLFYDSAHDRLFVAAGSQNRVLVFDTAVIVNGEAAVRVLGQNNFTSTSSAAGASGFFQPGGMDYDVTRNRLFVADDLNQRVLVFTNAGPSDLTDGQAATYVLGQPDFTTVTNGVTRAKMSRPKDLAYDSGNDRLFVCDMNSRRVLVFDVAPSSIANGQDASNVIGQPDFVTSNNSATQTGLVIPQSLTLDAPGNRLFVLDGAANRLLVYDTSSLAVAAQPAIAVLGQADFTSSGTGTSQTGLFSPTWVEFDSLSKRLYVADSANNRIVFYATNASMLYSASTLNEAPANDGSVATTLNLTLRNTRFALASGTLTLGTHYSLSNLPAGLGAVVTATSATSATIVFTGNAVAHESANNIGNVTLVFTDNAFSGRTAANIDGTTKNDIVVQFTNAPTPTSTPTPTPTPIATHTPTVTFTVIPTSSPTFSPTTAPTGTATPGPIGTSTPVQSPTATPVVSPTSITPPTTTPVSSPPPTPSQTEITARLLMKNEPVKSAIVYVLSLGAARTDKDGIFTIKGATPGTSYKLLIEHPNATFYLNDLHARAGEYREILGEVREHNPRACSENDISNSLFSAASQAVTLYRRIGKLTDKTTRGAIRIKERSTDQLNNYFSSSASVPGIILSCGEIVGCETRTLHEIKKVLLKQLNHLRHESLLVLRRLRISGSQNTRSLMRNTRNIKREHSQASTSVRALPTTTNICF